MRSDSKDSIDSKTDEIKACPVEIMLRGDSRGWGGCWAEAAAEAGAEAGAADPVTVDATLRSHPAELRQHAFSPWVGGSSGGCVACGSTHVVGGAVAGA